MPSPGKGGGLSTLRGASCQAWIVPPRACKVPAMLQRTLPLAVLYLLAGCGDDAATPMEDAGGRPDSGTDAAPPVDCDDDADCDDGVFCNGGESCGPDGVCMALPRECDDGIACTEDLCSESTS